jgi:DNA-binding NarL/FixJ family response regulator
MKVLVADGSAMLRERIVSLFSELDGIELIGQTQDWPETFHAIFTLKPHVLILDIQIIRGRGIDALKGIKQEDSSMAVIVLTHFTTLPYRRRCLEAGADFYLDKSTEIGKLREIIQSLDQRFNMK